MKFYTALVMIALLPLIMGFLPPKHSKLKVTSSYKDNAFHAIFKVTPNSGMQVTTEGPWQLKIKEAQGLQILKQGKPYTSQAFDQNIPGFSLKAQVTQPDNPCIRLSYELRAFICTVDKSRCYPEVHKGKYQQELKPNSCP